MLNGRIRLPTGAVDKGAEALQFKGFGSCRVPLVFFRNPLYTLVSTIFLCFCKNHCKRISDLRKRKIGNPFRFLQVFLMIKSHIRLCIKAVMAAAAIEYVLCWREKRRHKWIRPDAVLIPLVPRFGRVSWMPEPVPEEALQPYEGRRYPFSFCQVLSWTKKVRTWYNPL